MINISSAFFSEHCTSGKMYQPPFLLNNRQLLVIKRMLDEGTKGFDGGMNARKYIGITKTSKATATRDLQDLVKKDVFIPSGGGRSTNYQIKL